MREIPGDQKSEGGSGPDIYQQVDAIINPLKDAGLISEGALFPIQLTVYTGLVAGKGNQDRMSMMRALTRNERRELPFGDITCPVQTTVVAPSEPPHKEALLRYGFTITPQQRGDKTEWSITLPATLSSEAQALMLRQLQLLGELGSPEQGQQVSLPLYIGVIPREPISMHLSNNEDLRDDLEILEDMLSLAYSTLELDQLRENQEKLVTTDTITPQASLILGIFALIPGEEDDLSDLIYSNQILGTVIFEWLQLRPRPTILAQTLVEKLDLAIEGMEDNLPDVSMENARAIIHATVKTLTDLLYSSGNEDETE